MHSELVLGDVRERLQAFTRLVLCLLIDAVLLVLWAGIQSFVGTYTSHGIVVGNFTYVVSINLRLVLALACLAPVILIMFADIQTLVRKVSGDYVGPSAGDKDLPTLLDSRDARLPLECPPRIAVGIYTYRFMLLASSTVAVMAFLIAVVSTGATPELGIGFAAIAALLALAGDRLPSRFLASSISHAFSLSAIAALLGVMVLSAELLGLSTTLTTLVLLSGIVMGADLLLVWRVLRLAWIDRQSSREHSFNKHYVIDRKEGTVAGIDLEKHAPTRDLLQKAFKAIRRIPATEEDAEETKSLEIARRKCWRKYSQILDLISQGHRADISLYRKALLAEGRVIRYCEQLLLETKQLGPGAAPRHRVYSSTAGRRQLRELLLEWNAALTDIIERERELGTPNDSASSAGKETS